jgi:hypothetical protein
MDCDESLTACRRAFICLKLQAVPARLTLDLTP